MNGSTEKQKGNTANLKPWPKGVSGNPAGRPPKEASLTSLLKAELERSDRDNPKDQRTWNERIVIATLRLAEAGLPAALKEVWERIEGKVKQDFGVEMDLHNEITRRLQQGRLRAAERNREIAAEAAQRSDS